MPYAVDQEKLDDPSTTVLDIGKPPLKNIPTLEFPRMIYAHPTDKTKEHKTRIVNSAEELKAAEKAGWRKVPHIPQVPDAEVLDPAEYEVKGSIEAA